MERWHIFLSKPYKTIGDKQYIRHWSISDHGRVKWTYDHNDKQVFIEPKMTGGHEKTGRYLALSINDAPEKYIHRLVARFFVPNPDDQPTVNHLDGDKFNNHYTNLEWVSHKENTIHGMKTRGEFDQQRYDAGQLRQITREQNRIRRQQRIDQHLTLHKMGVNNRDISHISGYSIGTVRNDIKKYGK